MVSEHNRVFPARGVPSTSVAEPSDETVPPHRFDVPPPGAVAWLDVAETDAQPQRTGPLGMRISPLPARRTPYFFKGGRLRGTRCVWSASTLSGAQLRRGPRTPLPAPFDTGVHVLVRAENEGSVFDPVGTTSGSLQVLDVADEINERVEANTHLFTLNVPAAALGVESSVIAEMRGITFQVTQFQSHLLRGAVGLLLVGGAEISTPAQLVSVDRYLAALAAMLLRTAVARSHTDIALGEQLRVRTDEIIDEQSADPTLSPTTIATQLDVSLRQLYRAFTGTESPAARIRRRRLERAAEILGTRSGPGQVEQIAYECGFASAEYFSRAFRKEFGQSPRAYRAARRNSQDAPAR